MGTRSGAEPDRTAGNGARDPLVGTVINGKFHVHSSIARGGMGQIYYATQAPLDRPVALKVVQGDGANEAESQFLKRFLLEASILAKLQHPNVVTLYDYGKIEGAAVERYFIAMEFLDGRTLSERMKGHAVLPAAEVLVLLRQIARGLREAHARGIVHRDLKPSNIILVPEGDGGEHVKIVDFGIGKVLATSDVAEDLTGEGMMVGTPRYMAPEQFEGAASPASDIYSLGTIAYQAITGTLPFHGNSLGEFMVAKFAHPIRRFHEVRPDTDASETLEALVFHCLARRPEERPSMEAFFQHLAACEDELFGTSSPRTAPSGRPHLPPSHSSPSHVRPQPRILQLPEGMTGSSPGFGGVLHATPRPMSTAAHPQAPPARTAPVVLGLAAIVTVVALVTGALWVAHAKRASLAALVTGEAETVATDPVVTEPEDLPPPRPSFPLVVDSVPPGATVLEEGAVLGTTPIELTIDPDTVEEGPRTFVVQKDGFTEATLVQGRSEAPVRSVVALAPLAAEPVKPRPAGGGRSSGSRPSHGDIRLTR
jgi:serine/threonine protein kinase